MKKYIRTIQDNKNPSYTNSFKKAALYLTFGLFCNFSVNAQQDAQFTQFIFNKMTYNAAYAGNNLGANLSVIHRQQWIGLAGAPVSSAVNFSTRLPNKRVGLGFTYIHDEIGPTKSWAANFAYAYRITLPKGELAVGLQLNFRQYRVNWGEAVTIHQNDQLIQEAKSSKILPNTGFGVYYETEKFYVGLSSPHFVNGDLSLVENFVSDVEMSALEVPHYYAMAGYIFKINEAVKFQPSVLFSIVKNTPLSADLNPMLILQDKLWFGFNFRFGGSTVRGLAESIDFLLQYQVTPALRLGAAYDQSLSEIKLMTDGTFEFYAHYSFTKNKAVEGKPKYF